MINNFKFSILNSQFFKKTSGFSLLEMLIYIALVVIVISSIVFFGIWAIQVGAKTRINSEVLGNARRAMEIMVYEIRKSKSVYAPTSNFDAHPGQLSLEQASATGSDESSSFVDFFICGQALCLKREKESPVALTNSSVQVVSLIFNQMLNSVDSPSIRISLRIASASSVRPGDTTLIDLATAANLRSY